MGDAGAALWARGVGEAVGKGLDEGHAEYTVKWSICWFELQELGVSHRQLECELI